MTTNMLRAISEMLSPKDDAVFKTQVKCAKIMLDEIIKGMEPTTTLGGNPLPTPTPKPKPSPKSESPLPYKVLINEDKTLKLVEGLPLDEYIVVDGVSMTHAQAIGKKFSGIKLP